MEPLVSIIVPIYNTDKYLDKCINHIVNQTYKKLEIILVNDGSTDNSKNICNNWALKDNRIKVIHQKNKGLSGARNSGLNVAKGEYINFIDSDDFIELDTIEMSIKYAELDRIVCYGIINIYLLNNKKDVLISKRYYKLNTKEFLKYYLIASASWGNISKLDYFIGNSMNNKLFSANIFKKLRFSENERISEDIDLMIDIIFNTKTIILLPCAKYYYMHQNDNSITSQPFHEKLLKVLEIKKRIENKIKILEPKFLNYAQMSTIATCVYIINKFARLNRSERQKKFYLIEMIKNEINMRKKVIEYIGIKGKIKIWLIILNARLYIKFVHFIRVNLKI